MLAAAIDLFGERGFAGTTMGAIAEAAGVAIETVYATIGSKKALLRTAIDVAVVGDTEPVPLSQRPEWRRLGDGQLPERLRAAAEVSAAVNARSAGVVRALVEAAGSDPEVEDWRRELDARRRDQVRDGLELMLGTLPDDWLVDIAWVLLSPETYTRLVEDTGATPEQYRARMTEVLQRLVEPR